MAPWGREEERTHSARAGRRGVNQGQKARVDRIKVTWEDHFVELVVVFLGITLTFTLESWRDARKEADLEQKYLVSFLNDLESDKADYDSLYTHTERVQTDVQRLTDMFRQKVDVHPDTSVALLARSLSIGQLPRNHSTYASLTGSSNLSLITNYECQQKIVNYYQSLDQASLVMEVSNGFLDN